MPIVEPRMVLTAFGGKFLEEQGGDVQREGLRVSSLALMECKVAKLIGAELYERTGWRTAFQNGIQTRS